MRERREGYLTSNKKQAVKDRGGRPKSLAPDDRTLATLRGLGRIQATTRECAAVLGVSHQTFITFKNANPIVGEVLEQGLELGKQSLRRKQFKAAENGNPTMLVWLGKQYLGQTDKQDITASVTQDIHVSDARAKLEHLIDRQLATGPASGGNRKPH